MPDLAADGRYQLECNDLPMLLRLSDRNSMASSVESRPPFLSAPLASFLLSLPSEHLIGPAGQSK